MKLTKRLVAVALAILMIFGSFSAALTATAAGNGTTLGITTRFFRNVNGAWIETEKVVAGEEVKLGVYIDTDYYTGDGSILLYYNNTFFDKATDSNFAIGSYYQAGTVYDISGNAHIGADSQASSVNNAMLKNEKVTQEYLDTHEPIYITYTYGKSAKSRMFNGEKLFCEMLFKVKAAPTETTGLVEALESTAASTSFQRGRINIPKSEETESGVGGYPEMAIPMWNWNANLVFAEKPVSLYTNCTSASFDANGGKFAVTIGTATKYDNKLYSQGEAGTEISKLITSESQVIDSLPVPTKDGYAFKGWKVSGAEDATASEVTVYPAVNTDYVAVWERDDNVGSNVTFRTEIYRQDESGEWVYTEKVKPGENVKARLFIDTDYSAGDGQILFFYDGDFFDTQYKAEDGNLVEKYPTDTPVTINVNDSETSVTGANNIIAKAQKPSLSNRTIQELIKRDYITADYLANHPAMFMTYQFPSTAVCQVFSGDEWFAEFDLRVKDNAIGEGDFFVLYDTICNSTEDHYYAYTSIGKEDEFNNQADHASHMCNWAKPEDITCESNPVSVENTITFKANGGQFAAEDTETYVISGTVGAKVDYSTIPEISRSGWTFMGWIDASDETPTREEAKFADQLPATMTYNSDKNSDTALVYNAFWVNEVNITFANINPETEIAEVKGTKTVTVGADFVAPEEPTIDGYRFVGWTTEWDEENGILGNITGLPATYPATATTYYAVFSAKTYPVNYYVLDADIENPTLDDFKLVGVANVEYNTIVPVVPHGYNAPEGYVISVAYTDVSYADQIVFADPNKLVVGTKMPAHAFDLYYKIERAEFNAVFDAKEGVWADGDTTKTVPAVYGDEIVLPEEPTRAGYVFAGWTPSATIMDAEGKTFEATWTPDVFTATYYVDGAQYEAYRVEYADDMEIPADPYKEGYEFLGWAAEEGSNVTEVLPATMPAEDVNYYAVFEVNEYTIKFANTGDTTIDDITLPYGTEIPEVADPEREGYTFKGWAETSGASEADKVELPATMPVTPADGKIYYAIWAVKQYNVTWIVDGTETTETYDFGEAITKQDDPAKTGYTFSGWTPEFPEDGKLMPAEDLTYTAVFEANTYNAVFLTKAETETHDGAFADKSTSATVPTKFNEAIVAPAVNPTRTGYTFAGWNPVVDVMDEEGKTFTAMWTPNADTNYSVQFYIMNTSGTYELKDTVTMKGESDSLIDYKVVAPEHFTIDATTSTYDDGVKISPDGTTVVTVYFMRDSFNIVFDGKGGTVNGETSITTKYYYGSTVAVPAASRVGYAFAGWTDNNGNALDVNLTAVEAVTYYAKWEINQYTITFENTGDSVIAPITQDYATEIVAPEDPTKLGHEFTGWDEDIPATMPANDMTITAEWNVLSFDAIFNANGGAFEDTETSKTVEDVTFGEDVTAPTDVPSKEGYTFNGWFDADGNPVDKMDDEGKEYFADWEINQYTITFEDTGDSVIAPIIQDYATAVEAPADPEKEGYTFKGWDPGIPETMPADDMVITAIWEENEYTITFENTGDSVVDPIVQAYNSEVTAPEDPEKVGYDFAGWNPTVPSTMPLGGATVTAMWVPKTDTAYKVIVNYTDAATGVHADEYDYAGTTDNAIAIVDAVPNPEAENTEYVLISDLAVTGYVLDTEADNELTGVVAADGSTVLNIYYIPVKVKATFDADGGVFYDLTTSKEAELDYNALVSPVAPKGYDAPTKEGYTFSGWQGLSDSTRLQAARTFKAIWTPNTYKITWILDGVTQTPVSYEYNALIVKQTAPAKAGYKFVGWVDENGKAFEVPDNMPAKDLTIATKYEVLNYPVVWNDGTKTTSESREFGSAIVEPYKPVREGYTFGGWQTDDGKTPSQVATVPVGGVEFKAQWTKNSHKVYYYVLNPATGKFGSAVANADVLYDAVIPTEFSGYTAPTGYSLVNVAYTDFDLTATLAENAKMGDSDINLYYELAAKNYNAVFKANGGTWADEEDGEKTVSAAYNSTINAPVAPQYEGYEFIGWSPAVDKMDSEGKTFVAQWKAKTFTVTYKAVGGVWGEGESIETSKTFDVAFGATVTAPESNPVRTGYTFGGWNETVPTTMPAENLVFTAKWTIKSATITFMDGASTIDTVSGNYGTAVTAPADPQKDGYTFKGWDTAVPATMPENDMTINAVWSKNAYDIVWDVDGVKTIVKDVPYGDAITKASDPEKTGYEFKGWTGYTNGMTMPARDVTFTAVFEPKEYTVTFDANGGTWENDQIKKTVTAAYGTTLTPPVAPTKAGYTFQTWSPTVPATMPADNATYTAIWATAGKVDYTVETYLMNTEGTYTGVTPISTGGTATIDAYITVPIVAPAGFTFDSDATGNYTEGVVSGDGTTVFKIYYERNSYTVKFVGNGGTIDGNDEKSGTYYYGTTVAQPVAIRTGYEFAGWADAAENGNAVAVEVTVLGAATYYAQWKAATYTATFKAYPGAFNNGETTETTEFTYGTAITEPANAPLRDGYTFDKWTDADGKTPDDYGTAYAGDATFTANWVAKYYDAKFYTDNTKEETHDTKNAQYNTSYNVPTDPEKKGYKFIGWYDCATDKSAGLPEAGGLTSMPLNGAEYYAVWEVKEYNLVYRANNGAYSDGMPSKTYTVPFGTAKADMPAPESDPVRTGYTFTGYSPELPATMPAEQYNLVAQWSKNNYDVTFDAGLGSFESTGESTETATVPFEDYVYAPEEEPVRAGYDFGGWEDADGNIYNPGDEIGTMGANDMTFEAVWSAKENVPYTVKHYFMNVNGNYEGVAPEVDNLYGETDTTAMAAQKTRDNFTFDSDASTVSGTVTADGALVLELYYVREKNAFTIYDEDGNVLETSEVYFEAPISVEAPTKEGYDFDGWKDEEGAAVGELTTMPGDKLDIYESWTVKSYNVIFDANEGAWADEDTTKTVSVQYDSAITAPAINPVRAGYTFKGWFDAKENGKSLSEYAKMPTSALTFYARWEANKNDYRIEIYEMNPDGTMPEDPTSMVINNALVNEEVEANVTVPAGFTLDNENSVLSGTVPATGTLVLKVVLVRAPHKFTAIVDGVAIVDKVEYYYDQTVEQIAVPTKNGYTFLGWSTVKDSTTVNTVYPARMPNNDVTIYGVWSTDAYNATFDAGEGLFESTNRSTAVVPVEYGEDIVAPTEEPTREGFVFGGWKDSHGTIYQAGDVVGTMSNSNVKYEAVWNKSSFTVTFYGYEALDVSPYKSANASVVLDSSEYDYSDVITFPNEADFPENAKLNTEYYTFVGWSKTENGTVLTSSEIFTQTMPAEDTAYYAVYERVKVMLVPNSDDTYWTESGTGCTTVIDRAGGTVDDYDAATSRWYVYGLTDRMQINARFDEKRLDTYIDVSGDGYYEVVEFKIKEGSVGTGTVINVYDNLTGELVESFWIIIYGDLDGDGIIANNDYIIALTEQAGLTSWSYIYDGDEYIHYFAKAAELTGDNFFSITDAVQIDYYVNGIVAIDQATGLAHGS